MQLYYHPFSSASKRATMTASELEMPLELVHVGDLLAPSTKSEIGRLNPNGRIPILVDGDFILWESCAISQYLCDKTPGQQLYPNDFRARADINRWQFWSAQHLTPAIGAVGWERVGKPAFGKGDPDPKEIQRGESQLDSLFPILNEHLKSNEWMCLDRFTLADIAIAAPLMIAEPAGLHIERFGHIARWFRAVENRPSWTYGA